LFSQKSIQSPPFSPKFLWTCFWMLLLNVKFLENFKLLTRRNRDSRLVSTTTVQPKKLLIESSTSQTSATQKLYKLPLMHKENTHSHSSRIASMAHDRHLQDPPGLLARSDDGWGHWDSWVNLTCYAFVQNFLLPTTSWPFNEWLWSHFPSFLAAWPGLIPGYWSLPALSWITWIWCRFKYNHYSIYKGKSFINKLQWLKELENAGFAENIRVIRLWMVSWIFVAAWDSGELESNLG
jgi:hypothetical protein